MNTTIPSSDDVRAALTPFTRKQIKALGVVSGVSFHTIYKIQRGEIRQPNIDIVRDLMPHVEAMRSGASASTAGHLEGGNATPQ